jgi:hypothetical protein
MNYKFQEYNSNSRITTNKVFTNAQSILINNTPSTTQTKLQKTIIAYSIKHKKELISTNEMRELSKLLSVLLSIFLNTKF